MSKLIFSLCILASFQLKTFGHDYYFAYAELTYNQLTNQFEGTVIFSTHDLERAIEPNGSLIGKFENIARTDSKFNLIENYINQHLVLRFGCAKDSNAIDAFCTSHFNLEGVITQLNGTIECYISSNTYAVFGPIECSFDALMEQFTLQQNKLSFAFQNNKETLTFISSETTKNLTLHL